MLPVLLILIRFSQFHEHYLCKNSLLLNVQLRYDYGGKNRRKSWSMAISTRKYSAIREQISFEKQELMFSTILDRNSKQMIAKKLSINVSNVQSRMSWNDKKPNDFWFTIILRNNDACYKIRWQLEKNIASAFMAFDFSFKYQHLVSAISRMKLYDKLKSSFNPLNIVSHKFRWPFQA